MKPVVVLPKAENDIFEATKWYAAQHDGLGNTFLDDVEHALQQIAQHEYIGPVVHHSVRRYLLRRFPYGAFYQIEDKAIYLIALLHVRQSPRQWLSRAKK